LLRRNAMAEVSRGVSTHGTVENDPRVASATLEFNRR
jgi:hypothetical protein